MKLIVGLGNPGPSYLMTRHNVGFMTIDALSDNPFRKKHEALIQKTSLAGESVLLTKPQTYMNLSGRPVRDLLAFYKIPRTDLLIVQDDVDQSFLKMKFQKNRGHGGHNGIRNIHDLLKTPDYARLKLGVGRPELAAPAGAEKPKEKPLTALSSTDYDSQYQKKPNQRAARPSTADYVLSPFSKQERDHLKLFLEIAVQAVLCFIEKGFEKAAEEFNRRNRD